MLEKKELRDALLRKLAESGLDATDAKELEYHPYSIEELTTQLNGKLNCAPAAGFTIPYHTVLGKRTEFFRYRYLEQPTAKGFAALTVRKPFRYIQPEGIKPQVYFPKNFQWLAYLKKAVDDRWLLITEGELKAACASKLGFPTLGLGGVWNFKGKKELVTPDLSGLELTNMSVYIVYDSDAATNPQVLAAENALAKQLLSLKAKPFVLRLPKLSEGKTGLDDFLMAKKGGEKRLTALIEKAEEWSASSAFHELNEKVMFLRESATVLELATRNRWRAGEFTNSVYANLTYAATEIRKKEAVTVERPTAPDWIKWPGRAELERVTYIPGAPLIVDREYNAWPGWGLEEEFIKRGPINLWRELLDFLFLGAKEEHKKWFEQWLAYPLQHPGTKLFQTCVLWGRAGGTGKTLVGHTMERLYGKKNYTEVNERELHGSFNEWAQYKQFAMGEEITGGDKRGVADFLKGMITQKFLRINPKHLPSYVVPDCINWYFTSNHPDAFFISDNDRRYFVQEVRNQPLPRAFYRNYDKWYRSEEIGALFYHFLNLDLTGFDPMDHAPTTQSKEEMVADGRSDLGSWCAALRDNPDQVLRIGKGGVPLKRRLWTSTELHALYDPDHKSRVTINGLARELKNAGFRKVREGEPIWSEHLRQTLKLWIVRSDEEIRNLRLPKQFSRIYDEEIRMTVPEKKYAGGGEKKEDV